MQKIIPALFKKHLKNLLKAVGLVPTSTISPQVSGKFDVEKEPILKDSPTVMIYRSIKTILKLSKKKKNS